MTAALYLTIIIDLKNTPYILVKWLAPIQTEDRAGEGSEPFFVVCRCAAAEAVVIPCDVG